MKDYLSKKKKKKKKKKKQKHCMARSQFHLIILSS